MFGIKAQITKCVDDEGYPSFVECEFVDAYGCTQIFQDKDAIFTIEMLDRKSNYPLDGIIGCEVLERKYIDGRETAKVSTELPWHLESMTGETIFEVLQDQIVEFNH